MSVSTALLFSFIANSAAWLVCAYYVFHIKNMPIYHPLAIFLGYFLLGYVYRTGADWLYGGANLWNDVGFWPTAGNIVYATFVDLVGLASFVFIPAFLVGGIHDRLRMPKFSFRYAAERHSMSRRLLP